MDGQHASHSVKSTDVLTISLIGATGLRDARPWGKGLNMGAHLAASNHKNASSAGVQPSLQTGCRSSCRACEWG